MGNYPGLLRWAQSNHESLKLENISQLWSERKHVMMDDGRMVREIDSPGFEDEGRGYGLRNEVIL